MALIVDWRSVFPITLTIRSLGDQPTRHPDISSVNWHYHGNWQRLPIKRLTLRKILYCLLRFLSVFLSLSIRCPRTEMVAADAPHDCCRLLVIVNRHASHVLRMTPITFRYGWMDKWCRGRGVRLWRRRRREGTFPLLLEYCSNDNR